MSIDLEKQKQYFLECARNNIKRDGLDELLKWLDEADFFTAPASTRYHGAYAGGLAQHSLDVYKYAKRVSLICDNPPDLDRDNLNNPDGTKATNSTNPATVANNRNNPVNPNMAALMALKQSLKAEQSQNPAPLNPESIAIASLFHDLCKVNFYRMEFRNQKIDGEWQQMPFYTIQEQFPYGGHGSKSVFMVERFLKLKPEEAVAINCHMGFSDGNSSTVLTVGKSYEAYPLAWVIHVADEAAAYLVER